MGITLTAFNYLISWNAETKDTNYGIIRNSMRVLQSFSKVRKTEHLIDFDPRDQHQCVAKLRSMEVPDDFDRFGQRIAYEITDLGGRGHNINYFPVDKKGNKLNIGIFGRIKPGETFIESGMEVEEFEEFIKYRDTLSEEQKIAEFGF